MEVRLSPAQVSAIEALLASVGAESLRIERSAAGLRVAARSRSQVRVYGVERPASPRLAAMMAA